MTQAQAPAGRLTAKGRATRDRIVETAAALFYERGVHRTSNEDVRAAAGVSGSQLARHFPTKQSLVREVVTWRADLVVRLHLAPEFGGFDSLAGLRRWADSCVARVDMCRGGCFLGSLAGEVTKGGFDVEDGIAEGFERWEQVFRQGLGAMRDRGELAAEADPRRLAHVLLAAFQGGMLLDQAAGSVEPLRAALDGALAYVATFATDRAVTGRAVTARARSARTPGTASPAPGPVGGA